MTTLTVNGHPFTIRTVGPADRTPQQLEQHAATCDLCYVGIAHTVAACDRERGVAR